MGGNSFTLFVSPHLWGTGGGVQVQVAGYPPSSDLAGGGYPDRGHPTSGTPPQCWLGGTPPWVPPSELAGGYPDQRYPNSGTPPHRSWLGVPHLGYPHQTWLGGTPIGSTPPQVHPPPSELAGGYPTLGTPIRAGWGIPQSGVPQLGYTPPLSYGHKQDY